MAGQRAKELATDIQEKVSQFSHDESNGRIVKLLSVAEERSGKPRETFIWGAIALFGLYLVLGAYAEPVADLVILAAILPAATRFIKSGPSEDGPGLALYLVVNGMMNAIEFVDIYSYFPIFYPVKVVLFLALHPQADLLNPIILQKLRGASSSVPTGIQGRNQVSQKIRNQEENPNQDLDGMQNEVLVGA